MKLLIGSLAVAFFCAACGSEVTSADARVISIETTACGNASRTSGAGVIVEDGWAMVSAHVVAGAGSVTVAGPDGDDLASADEVDIVVFDAAADLALLRVPGASASPVLVGDGGAGDAVLLAGGGPSPAAGATILRGVEVRIEAVRSEERVSRVGYEIDTRVALGDSGSGVYDEADTLIGIVFGRTGEDEDRSFVVGGEAISNVLVAERTSVWTCDPVQHQIVERSASDPEG